MEKLQLSMAIRSVLELKRLSDFRWGRSLQACAAPDWPDPCAIESGAETAEIQKFIEFLLHSKTL